MTKIHIHDDGKQKWQSFTASAPDFQILEDSDGYGATPAEAIDDLHSKLFKLALRLRVAVDDITSRNIEIAECDLAGQPISKEARPDAGIKPPSYVMLSEGGELPKK